MASRGASKGIGIRQACGTFAVRETCCPYRPKLVDKNAVVADLLPRLTFKQKDWGFGLRYMYLRNVKCLGCNHNRTCRIGRELKVHLRINPKKYLVRETPQRLAAPSAPNQMWSTDFYARPAR